MNRSEWKEWASAPVGSNANTRAVIAQMQSMPAANASMSKPADSVRSWIVSERGDSGVAIVGQNRTIRLT